MRNINLYQNPILFIAYFYLYRNEINTNNNEKNYLIEDVQYKLHFNHPEKNKLHFNHPVKELIFNFRLNNEDRIENNNENTIENIDEDIMNEDIQINEIIYLDIKTIFIIDKYISNDDTIYI